MTDFDIFYSQIINKNLITEHHTILYVTLLFIKNKLNCTIQSNNYIIKLLNSILKYFKLFFP